MEVDGPGPAVSPAVSAPGPAVSPAVPAGAPVEAPEVPDLICQPCGAEGQSADSRNGEAAVVRAARRPKDPTPQEREDHAACHVPFRSWCRHCVAGMGRAEPHVVHDRSDSTIPQVCFDYGYMGDGESDERASPVLAIKSDQDRYPVAEILPSKGTENPYGVQVLVRAVVDGGWPKVTLKSDGEPAIVALRDKARKILTETYGKHVLVEESAVG